jgi:hypothetical protein
MPNKSNQLTKMIKPNSFVFLAAIFITVLSHSLVKANDGLTGAMKGSSYYKVHPLFNPHPVEKKNYTVSRLDQWVWGLI